eukprot:3807350-Amphidinium_carterae.1
MDTEHIVRQTTMIDQASIVNVGKRREHRVPRGLNMRQSSYGELSGSGTLYRTISANQNWHLARGDQDVEP